MPKFKQEIKDYGFYSFIRENIKDEDVASVMITFADIVTSRLSEEDYDAVIEELLDNITDDDDEE